MGAVSEAALGLGVFPKGGGELLTVKGLDYYGSDAG